ncbi:proline racemase family protein [Evansella halocellulosilytica]|uniref:proline racemase family protein n=1 Tax=Evansella halocellulosilytica TaxID=2011013 RepID=UPI000BB913C8|nr:proline racemase family protein [Evansella halocellulosilytica]
MEINKVYTTVDAHTAGEPLRIITGGLPPIKGQTMIEKRAYFRENHDDIRRFLMYEPRGHHGMYGCVITSPVSEGADFGVLFMHNEGFSTMCGHGIIAVVTAGIEIGLLPKKEHDSPYVIDTPAGKVTATAFCEGSTVKAVSFENVPSFMYYPDFPVHLRGTSLKVDIAFGGAFYAVVQADDLGVNVTIDQLNKLKSFGKEIKLSIEKNLEVVHPIEKELKGIYGVIISDVPKREDSELRNVTIFADGQLDRSPCGTGTCARMATLYARKKLQKGSIFVHESIVSSQLEGTVFAETKVDKYEAIVPSIKGKSSITGLHKFMRDPSDPLKDGFLLG